MNSTCSRLQPVRRFTAGLTILLSSLILQGCMMVNFPAFLSSELKEIELQGAKGWFVAEKILLVDIKGMISDEDSGGLFGGRSVCTPYYMKAVLNKAEKDSTISAVVLRIDSPGGTVSASQVLAREISEFRKRTGKPVYAHIQATGCSGAYMLAASCSSIHIQPAAISGSIGVIAVIPKLTKLADKVGYEQMVFKSGPMKDIGSSMREMTDEEKAVFQKIIDSSYNDFIDWIMVNRPQSGNRETLKTIADGRIYDAKEALENKLADRICHLDKTISTAMTAAGIKDAGIVTYGYFDTPDANLYTPASSSRQIQLMNIQLPATITGMESGFYYLWLPGR